jgi:hypothetical protein
VGVKRHFVLVADNGNNYAGPAAYYFLLNLWKAITLRHAKLAALTIPEGGWRKQITTLFERVCAYKGERPGRLFELKVRNPERDPTYRDFLHEIRKRYPKLNVVHWGR